MRINAVALLQVSIMISKRSLHSIGPNKRMKTKNVNQTLSGDEPFFNYWFRCEFDEIHVILMLLYNFGV